HGDLGHDPEVGRVDREHGPGGPVGDVQPGAVAGERDVVGPHADVGGLRVPGLVARPVQGPRVGVPGVAVAAVEHAPAAVARQAGSGAGRRRTWRGPSVLTFGWTFSLAFASAFLRGGGAGSGGLVRVSPVPSRRKVWTRSPPPPDHQTAPACSSTARPNQLW